MFSPVLLARYALVLLLMVWTIIGATHHDAFRLISGVNLLIHEFGHLLFAIFGNDRLTALGGTLMQLIMPGTFLAYFLRRRDWYSAAIMLFWLGQNFFDVAVYMADARREALPLIAIGAEGDGVLHDWKYLLSYWGWLMYDTAIAGVIKIIGWCLCFGACALGLYTADYTPATEETTPHLTGGA